ncbi:FdhF/YdeP family oxidoreductase [Psychromonas sp. Urea-02u-13]|uniref:FdhF/YdeP family oxidoreductase n=1 Tax=Psychromonas sp. Urea-02u-13 TaxID=2058326 RepID=UPI000C345326|nr:FdhF/YdeP family oxidoreductase [Psychromonas sp. Urea-02u-13]PKG37663.1 CbbBc protein [Psychromonas sp. Urea-02u-13]
MSYKEYKGSAGGWGALASTAKHLLKSENVAKNIRNLLKTNQDHGFDCPGCAWGEQTHSTTFRFCENGAKAVNWEATSRRVDANFFAGHPVSWLKKQSDYYLEYQGRLAEPVVYNPVTDLYEAISWQQAFDLIAEQLNALESPDQAEFYTSGRASNEAAFLYQLFARKLGTNNFPDCSNMCHEASGVALKQAIGVGKGTVTMDDFDDADAIFVFGQNPGTNHPRMLETLSTAAKRGAKIISFNPLKERGLERFTNPQVPTEMLTGGATKITQQYFTPNLGGDMAAVRGMVKVLLARHQQTNDVFDQAFIDQHTQGLADYLIAVEATQWQHIVTQSGLSEAQITQAADLYQQSKNVIITWAMGITQHKHSVETIQEITNLQLLFGNVGRKGAGLCPVRGHSNVQGDRTMGINEKPDAAFLHSLEETFSFKPPQHQGHNVVQSIEAMLSGKSKVFIALGGNFVAATPDTPITEQALSQCELTVSIATKLNRTHLTVGKKSLILPCLGRTDIDMQNNNPQSVTVEDSFSMVHASQGVVKSDTAMMLSEPAIIAGMAQATLGDQPIEWLKVIEDYDRIRDLIAKTIPGFKEMNQGSKQDGGFYLGNTAAQRVWSTASAKAQFKAYDLPVSIVSESQRALTNNRIFVLQTLRSHDQYNTTIYGFEDRYRGISGDRKIIMMHPKDIEDLGFKAEDRVDVEALWPDDVTRKVTGFQLIPYDTPRGNIAAYFPEANPLVALASYGKGSFTPTSKTIAVVITAHVDAESII